LKNIGVKRRNKMSKTFIFDYDDTLAWNQHDYCYAQVEFLKWILDRIGAKAPDVQTILDKEVKIDREAVKTMNFQMERFPSSFRDTYKWICQRAGITDHEGEEKAYAIGMRAFDESRYREQGLLQDAAKTLDFLVEQKDELLLLTKGDERVQRKKLEVNNLSKWFGDKMYIVARKTQQDITDLVGSRDPNWVWHVGNSFKSDVIPALKAGIWMIYIPYETWAYEREHDDKDITDKQRCNLITFARITDIRSNYHLL
jgi:putative hydrolase of the HAD superfamily